MAKITGVANNDTGDEAKAKINEAMASVEVDSEFSGDGNTGSVLKFLGRIYNTARTFYTYLSSTNLTANRTLTIQDKDIIIAGLTDIQKGLQLAIDLSATTAGNPGTGLARFNDSDQSAVTALYVNNSEYGGDGSIEDFIGILNADSVIKLTAQGNRAKWVNYKVSSVADNSTYYTISLTVANKGTDFESGDVVGVEVLNAGGSGGTVTIDSIPTYGSTNAVSSGGVYKTIKQTFSVRTTSDYILYSLAEDFKISSVSAEDGLTVSILYDEDESEYTYGDTVAAYTKLRISGDVLNAIFTINGEIV